MDRDTELCFTEADTETWSCLLLAGVLHSTALYTPLRQMSALALITGPRVPELAALARAQWPLVSGRGPSQPPRPLFLACSQLTTRPLPPQLKSHDFNLKLNRPVSDRSGEIYL